MVRVSRGRSRADGNRRAGTAGREQLGWLLASSPYTRDRGGTRYPACCSPCSHRHQGGSGTRPDVPPPAARPFAGRAVLWLWGDEACGARGRAVRPDGGPGRGTWSFDARTPALSVLESSGPLKVGIIEARESPGSRGRTRPRTRSGVCRSRPASSTRADGSPAARETGAAAGAAGWQKKKNRAPGRNGRPPPGSTAPGSAAATQLGRRRVVSR